MYLLTKINLVAILFFSILTIVSCGDSPKGTLSKEKIGNNSSSDYDKLIQSYVLKIDSQLDTNEYRERKRFINAFDYNDKYNCKYDFGSSLLNKSLIKELGLCTNSKDIQVNYHLILNICEKITDEDFHIFTFDKEQKDSSVLFIAICEGDVPVEKVSGTTLGTFLVFKKQKSSYQLTDIGFGKLVAFDFDKNNRIQPIIFGESKDYNYPNYIEKNGSPNHLEIRMAWNGEHLQANEIISAEFPEKDMFEQIFSINEMKKRELYTPIRQAYIGQADDILNNVKIHWRFRSWSLKYKQEPNAIEQHKKKWTKGFKIE